MAKLALSPADRFVIDQLLDERAHHDRQVLALNKQMREFAKSAPVAEQEAREVLNQLVARLTPDQREALMQQSVEQLSAAEIAVVMGRSTM